jgi:cutinase
MVTLARSVMAKCPDTKILLGGYSQGAMQVHQALGSLGSDAGKITVCSPYLPCGNILTIL